MKKKSNVFCNIFFMKTKGSDFFTTRLFEYLIIHEGQTDLATLGTYIM